MPFFFRMNAGIDLNRPRAAACPDCDCAGGYPPDLVRTPELPTITAAELWVAVRHGAVAGLPLPVTGMLPVAVRDVAMQIHPDEWRRYERRCADERELDAVTGPIAATKPRF